MQRWLVACRWALGAELVGMLRSLVAAASKRAARIEAAVRSARLAEYRSALAAGGPQRGAAVARAPSRLAFSFVRGLSGWVRSPVADTAKYDDGLPDADDFDFDLDGTHVDVDHAPRAEAVLAPLSEQGAFDKEADGWARNWAVGVDYWQPELPEELLVHPPAHHALGVGSGDRLLPCWHGRGGRQPGTAGGAEVA